MTNYGAPRELFVAFFRDHAHAAGGSRPGLYGRNGTRAWRKLIGEIEGVVAETA